MVLDHQREDEGSWRMSSSLRRLIASILAFDRLYLRRERQRIESQFSNKTALYHKMF